MDVTLGNALELALSAGVIGEELGGNPALNTRLREAVNFEKVVPAGEAPAEPKVSPWPYGLWLVIEGGRTVTHAAADRASPRPAVRLLLVTVDGERVGHAALRSNKSLSTVGCLSTLGRDGADHERPLTSPISRQPAASSEVPGSDAKM